MLEHPFQMLGWPSLHPADLVSPQQLDQQLTPLYATRQSSTLRGGPDVTQPYLTIGIKPLALHGELTVCQSGKWGFLLVPHLESWSQEWNAYVFLLSLVICQPVSRKRLCLSLLSS